MDHKIICRDEKLRQRAQDIVSLIPLDVVHEVIIKEHKSTRTLEQNNKMWAMLGDLARELTWHGHKLTSDDWKDILTAGLKQQRIVPGIDGGFVALGQSTRRMKIKDMVDLIELAQHFGDQQQVKWSAYEQN